MAGNFDAGRWIIWLFMYFILYFLVVWGVTSLQAVYYGSANNSIVNDPGFQDLVTNYASYGGRCEKPTNIQYSCVGLCLASDAFYISCRNQDNPSSCERMNNCQWRNGSFLWWTTGKCAANFTDGNDTNYENVNLTFYGFPHSSRAGWFSSSDLFTSDTYFCDPLILKDKESCTAFGCSWMNSSDPLQFQQDINAQYSSLSTVYKAIGIMFNFRFELSMSALFGWIFTLFFTVLPSIILAYSIYKLLPLT
jgi:hypothetical protein